MSPDAQRPDEDGNREPRPATEYSRHIGAGMAASAVIMLVFVLTLAFDRALDERRNPNLAAVAMVAGGSEELELAANRDGHYLASGRINGVEVVFILDTGATTVAIPESLAERAGLERGPEVQVSTANGWSHAYLTRLAEVELGGFRLNDVSATINPGLHGDEVLLGMNVLGAFEIVQRGRRLTLRQPSQSP